VVLTAAATVLAMIPLTRSVFWGPMAFAIMGGLTVATLLTIFFVPALYAAWFGISLPFRRRRHRAGGRGCGRHQLVARPEDVRNLS
jgi:multidrug efflux pump